MINHKNSFLRTYNLINNYITIERRIIIKIITLVLFKNLLIIPIPYLIQMLVNDYLNMNLDGPLFLISFLIFFLLVFSYAFDNINVYITEILKRDLFIRNFFRTHKILSNENTINLNTYQVPRFLEVSFAKEEFAFVLKSVSQIVVVMFFGTLIISSYHPFFFIYCLVLIILTLAIVFFLFPRALLFQSIVSDVKFKINERLMYYADGIEEKKPNNFFMLASKKYLKNTSKVFRIMLSKSLLIGMLIALAQGFFIYISGQFVFSQTLSVGQFVAAELVLTYILASIYHFTNSLDKFINIIVSLDKLDTVISRKI